MRSSETGRRRAAEVAERKRRTEDAGGNPKKSSGISGAERVREKIDCLRAEGIEKYPVDLVCRTLGIKRSSFYQRVNNPKTDKETDDETLKETMTGIFIENKEEYGRVRMRKAMREAGYPMSEGKVHG